MTDLLTVNDHAGEHPRTWYRVGVDPLPSCPRAEGQMQVDVCIIGGGFTGLSAALHLAEAGYEVAVLEANRLGAGASGRNGGQVGTGQRRDQVELEEMVGPAHARQLWELSLEAVALVRDLADRAGVGLGAGIIAAAHKPGYVAELHDYARHMSEGYGYDLMDALDKDGLRARVGSDDYHGGVLDRGGAHLNPYAFVTGLARLAQKAGAKLYERSRVIRITRGDPARVTTSEAQIDARFVLFACNGYHGDLIPEVAQRVMPINNFIAVTEPLSPEVQESLITGGHAVADTRFVVNYFRLDQGRMVFGGSESYGYRFPADIAAKVRRPMEHVFPQLKGVRLTHAWGGTLGITMNRMPQVTRIAGNILSAGGFSGHGVAMGTFSGKVMAHAVQGQAERFDLMASVPTQRFPGGTTLRWPLLVLAMLWYSMRDRL